MAKSTITSSKKDASIATQGDRPFLPGIYMATVVDNADANRTGRLTVHISYLTKDPKSKQLFRARWSSPFAGSTNPAKIGKDQENYDDAMKTYGMWFPPPDVGNIVLVAFADGNLKNAYVISSTLPDQFNYMLPGNAGGRSYQAPSFDVPVVEKNKFSGDTSLVDTLRPANHPFAEAITVQGLIKDPLRGAATSSARRETPSKVFGILTKGVRDPEDKSKLIQAGHQFIMDDDIDSRNIRIRTGGGNQILLDDTNGIIYMINKGGKAWVELDMLGNINFFGEGSINFRAKGDFNLRADKNINIEAGNNLNLKAAGDNDSSGYKGLGPLSGIGIPPLGVGGNIRFDAAADLTGHASLNLAMTANGGDIDLSSGGRTAITASSPAPAVGGIQLSTLGPIAISPKLGLSVDTPAGITLVGSSISEVAGSILMNSGFGMPPLVAVPASPAPRIGGTPQQDQSSKPPVYRKEDSGPASLGADFTPDFLGAAAGAISDAVANSGEQILPDGGERPEGGDTITTIVGVLLTAEPYSGHAQYDPTTDAPSSMEEDESADGETGTNAIEGDTPASADTPNGLKIPDPKAEINNAIDSAISKGKDYLNQELGGYKDMLPDQLSNFNLASLKNINSLGSVMSLAGDLGIAIPPIRFQTSNAEAQKIIGIMKDIQDAEARLNQFVMDAVNLPQDIMSEATKAVQTEIDGAINEVKQELQNQNPPAPEAPGGT